MNALRDSTESNCPELGEMAAYVDGRLDEDARQRLDAHIEACRECRELLVEVLRALGVADVNRPPS